MNISYDDDEIILRTDDKGTPIALERAYLMQFDGATVKFVQSSVEDKQVGEQDRLVIRIG